MKLTQTILGLILAWTGSVAPAQAAAPEHYNFVVVLADDLGAKELACYGHPNHQTPNLDRIAREGMLFRTAYVTPLCTPTRVMVMTGQYPQHSGFFGMKGCRPKPTSPMADIGSKFTFADLVKTKGYRTALSGKWQLTGKVPSLVFDCGFDEYRMWAYAPNLPPGVEHTGAWESPGKTARYWNPCLMENGKYLPTKKDDYGPDLFNNFAMDFIQRNKSNPFLVYFTMTLTHGPHYSTPDTTKNAEDRATNSKDHFKEVVEYLDKTMGRLVNAIDAAGLKEKTLFFFIGDNGTGGEGKGTVTELGVRVPLIVRCPGTVKAGVVSDALVSGADIYATMMEFAKAKVPEGHPIDGKSLGPVLRGEQTSHREWLYSYLDDKHLLRDSHWLLEGNGTFFDCGASRDGTGYKNVTDSAAPEVAAAKKRFAEILAQLPGPKMFGDELTPPPTGKGGEDEEGAPVSEKKAARKKNKAKKVK